MILLLKLQIFLILIFKVNAQVKDLDCDSINNTFTVAGTNVTFACTITTTAIRWDIQPLGTEINFNFFDHGTGANITMNGFTSIYTRDTVSANSTLSFVLDLSLNDTTVTCIDITSPRSKTCSILVISPPEPPQGFEVKFCTLSTVGLEWNFPLFDGGAEVQLYHITVDPQPGNDTSCPGGECYISSNFTTFNVTGLNYNETYCFTVGAENEVGIGNITKLCVPIMANVPPAISTSPSVCVNYNGELILEVNWTTPAINDTKTPPILSYETCCDDMFSISVNNCCSAILEIESDEEYNISVLSRNAVGYSQESPVASVDTVLLTSVTERNITSDSVVISYTTIYGCSNFSSDLEVQLSISECNGTSTEITEINEYVANGDEETFNITSLMSNCYYNYTLQVVDGNKALGMSDSGVFKTIAENTTIISTTTISTTSTQTQMQTPSTTSDPVDADFPVGATVGIVIGIIIFIAVLIIILIIVMCVVYFSKVRFKSGPEHSSVTITYAGDTVKPWPTPVSNVYNVM